MIVSDLTSLLLVTLGLAALFGLVIGASLMRIKSLTERKERNQRHLIETENLREQLHDLEGRHRALRSSVAKTKQSAESEINRQKMSAQQQDALQVHSKLQAKRIASLDESLIAAEERGNRLQQNFDRYKIKMQRELEMSRRAAAQLDSDGITQRTLDLPVLNKRVDTTNTATTLPTASLQAIQAMLEQELDIPILAESEISGSVDDIDFESMLSTDEMNPVG
jgi:acyl transferase domain-containing protein